MDELLQKLLDVELLTEETKSELQNAFTTRIDEAVAFAKQEARQEIELQLAEQWVKERDIVVEAVDEKVNEFLLLEVNELRDDIKSFRDLEAEYASKLVESKQEMASKLKQDMKNLVGKLDQFLETRLSAELVEMREDIEEVRRLQFGKDIFEAFVKSYITGFVDESSIQAQLHESRKQSEVLSKRLQSTSVANKQLERKVQLETILRPLGGDQRDVMETLLRNVPTEKLEEGYKTYIGRVVKQAPTSRAAKKEVAPITEAASHPKQSDAEGSSRGMKITGDNTQKLQEQQTLARLDESAQVGTSEEINRYRRLAGIN